MFLDNYYEVVCGGKLGVIYGGNDKNTALYVYEMYVKASANKIGVIAGQNVQCLEDGEIIAEHINNYNHDKKR